MELQVLGTLRTLTSCVMRLISARSSILGALRKWSLVRRSSSPCAEGSQHEREQGARVTGTCGVNLEVEEGAGRG